MSRINTAVQPFKTEAFHNGKFIEVTEQAFQGTRPRRRSARPASRWSVIRPIA